MASSPHIAILMLGGAKRVSMARMLARSAENLGFTPIMASYELSPYEPVAEVAQIVVGKRWRDPGLLPHLSATVDSLCDGKDVRAKVVIPFVDGAVAPAAQLALLRPDIYSPTGSAEMAERLFDKAASAALFAELSLPIPETLSPERPVFPLIAKPRYGSASQGIAVVSEPSALEPLLPRISDYLLQRYVERGVEYTVDCFVDSHGSILAASPRRRLAVSGGEVTRTVTVAYPELDRLSRLTLSALSPLGLRGAVTLQFIEEEGSGQPLLMEINPRLGGGSVCSVHAGVPLPAMLLREALGLPALPAEAEPGVEIARYPQEVAFHHNQSL